MRTETNTPQRACNHFEGKGRCLLIVALIAILFLGRSGSLFPAIFGHALGKAVQPCALKPPHEPFENSRGLRLSAESAVGFSAECLEASGYWEDCASQSLDGFLRASLSSNPTAEPDFDISSEPSSISVWQGSSNSSTIRVRSVNGFNGSVWLLSVWSWPAPFGVTVDLPSPVVPPTDGFGTAMLTVTAGPNATTGDFVLTVIGDSGTPEHELRHTLDVPVSISTAVTAADDFKIFAHPPSLSLANRGPGASATITISVQSVGAFSSAVALTASAQGLTLAFTDTGTPETTVTPPVGGEASKVLTAAYASMASVGSSVIVTGTSGALTHTVALPVQVAIVDCLIAVATYGSELSPEVQFLRSFRDGSILKTKTGSSFMVAFNAWYYSFSPRVAQLINEHSTLRTVTKSALYPLIGILRLGAAAFHFFPTNLEVGAVLSGLLVSSLFGVVYLALPVAGVLAYSSRARRTAQRLQTPAAVTLVGALVVVAITTVVGGPAILMTLATSTLVLTSVVVSTLLASRGILRLLKRV